MIIEKSIINKKDVHRVTFDSINEFHDYIKDTPLNDVFRWQTLNSSAKSPSRTKFTGTKSFEEAEDILKNGWDDMAEKLEKRLKVKTNDIAMGVKRKPCYGVAGYQACVHRYLQGIPTNMISQKLIASKQKVVTIIKSIGYNCSVEKETIIEESVKAMEIIKKVESQGFRCNLDVAFPVEAGNLKILVKIRVKKANERLNVSKLAFPLVHPSMLRRLIFRFIETYPDITSSFLSGYGCPLLTSEVKGILKDNEILIPAILKTNVEDIKDISDIK